MEFGAFSSINLYKFFIPIIKFNINNFKELNDLEKASQELIKSELISSGVKILQPETVYIETDVQISKDVIIEPNVVIKKGVKIMTGTTVKSFSYLENCYIGKNCSIGHNTIIEKNVLIGNNYKGGIISPGIQISLNTLSDKASLIPKIDLKKITKVIGKDTTSAVRSGFFWGYAGLIDNIINLIKKETKKSFKVIITGGFSELFKDSIKTKVKQDFDITINGLIKASKLIK